MVNSTVPAGVRGEIVPPHLSQVSAWNSSGEPPLSESFFWELELILLSLRRFLPSIFHLETDQWIGEIYIGDEYLNRPFSSSSTSFLHFISIHVIGAHRLSGNSPSGALDFEALLNFKEVSQISTIPPPPTLPLYRFIKFQSTGAQYLKWEGDKGSQQRLRRFFWSGIAVALEALAPLRSRK